MGVSNSEALKLHLFAQLACLLNLRFRSQSGCKGLLADQASPGEGSTPGRAW